MSVLPSEERSLAAARATLRQQIMGFRTTQLVCVAARLRIADLLARGPQTSHELARIVEAEPVALYRLLRALAALGLLEELPGRMFLVTSAGKLLQTDFPGSLRSLAVLYGEDWLWQSYQCLYHSIKTGQSAFLHAHGETYFAYLEQHPAAAAVFQEAMSGFSVQEADAILRAFDFASIGTVVDLGGGHGALVAALLQAHPKLEGIVFDLIGEADGSRRLLADSGVAARAQFVAGDFFVDVPSDGDLYVLKSVIHNWNDEAALNILKKCRQAMAPHSRLLVIERVIFSDSESVEATLFDINMLVIVGGQERTELEYHALFDAAGFQLEQIIPTDSSLSLICGTPQATG